jgi:hypothetical protein
MRSSQTNEWDLMKQHQKIILILGIGFSGLVYFGFGAAMAVWLIGLALVRFDFARLDLDALGLLMLLAGALSATYFFVRFRKDIAESRNRLREPDYRAFLTRHGFLPPPGQQQEQPKYPERFTS